MEFTGRKSVYTDYIFMFAGTALMAVAINSIYDRINLVTGGFTGIAIIVKQLTGGAVEGGVPLGITNLILNVPVFLMGIKIKGFRFLGRTFFSTIMLSVWLSVLPVFPIITEDLVLASIFGGVICGAGMGMVFAVRGTTGGTDMVAALIQHYIRHYSISQIMQIIDGAIVMIGAYMFGISKALYAIIAIFVTTRVSDGIIEGLKFSKIAYIITEKEDLVAEEIMQELRRGVTGIDAKGMYSKNHKHMLFCVVSKKEIVILKELVTKADPKAFVIVTDAREVLGEGFLECKK